MLKSVLPDKLPDGVCEVIPGALYVGGAQAAASMILDWNVRCVVRCVEDAHDYQRILDDLWVSESELRFEQHRAKKTCDKEGSHCEGCEGVSGSSGGAPGAEVKQNEKEADAEDLDAIVDHHGATIDVTGSSSAVAVEDIRPPTREEWLRHRPPSHEVRTFHCPLEDTMTFSLIDFDPFMSALRFIDDAMLQRGAAFGDWEEKPAAAEHDENADESQGDDDQPAEEEAPQPAVYIHCLAGRSRSPSVAIAYLMTRKQLSLQEAIDMLAPQMRPNPNFIRQLMAMEQELLSYEGADGSSRRSAPFDLRAYFVDGLSQMHPALPEDVVEACLDACGGNVEAARMMLTKKAFELAKEKASIDSLLAVINEAVLPEAPTHFSEAEVQRVFYASEKNRTVALRQLLEEQKARQAFHDGASNPLPQNASKSARSS